MKNTPALYFPILLFLSLSMYSCLPRPTKPVLELPDTAAINKLITQANDLTWHNPDSAEIIFEHAIENSRRANYVPGIIRSKIALGSAFLNRGDYANSLLHYESALTTVMQQERPDSSFMEQLYNNMAATYVHSGNYQESAQYFYKALDVATRMHDEIAIARIDNNIGTILYEIGETDKAFYYIEQGKNIAYRLEKASYLLPYLYLAEGKLLSLIGERDRALEQCQHAIRLAKKQQTYDALHDALNYCGNIYKLKDMRDKAIRCFEEALGLPEEYPPGKMRANIYLGKIYLQSAQYILADRYLNAGLKIAQKLNARRELVDLYAAVAQLDRATGKHEQAYDYYDKVNLLGDSIYGLEKINAVNLLAVKYQTAQKDKEIAENKLFMAGQKAKIVHKNTLIWSISLSALFLMGTGLFLYYNRQRMERQRRALAIFRARSEGEEQERARLARDLHDGIGGLLSTLKMHFGIMERRIPAIAQTEIYKESNLLLDDTIAEVRKTAHNLMPELILQHGLMEAVRIFCNNVQDDEGLTIDFQYYGLIENLENGYQLAIYRIVQELVQNILKHAKATLALVQLSQHNHVLDITVEDNGVGFVTAQEQKGMGLKSIIRRVRELNGKMHIDSTPGNGTTIYIEFNLHKP